MTELEGEKVDDRYRLIDLIDSGTYGEVYRADRVILGQGNGGLVAVKVLKPGLAGEHELLEEVRKLQRCQHPNVIRLHASGKNHQKGRLEGRFFLAMELADESLALRLTRGLLTADETRALAVDICSGLQHLHASNLVHRDLKPANILRVGATWKLSDFGLVREPGYLRADSRLPGTPAYSPPEDTGPSLDTGFDMWSLGCILSQCLTGCLPYKDGRKHEITINPSIPEPFLTLTTGCLRQDPKRRWTAAQCIEMLNPNATPLHMPPALLWDACFLCAPGNDCARAELSGVVGQVQRGPDGIVCTIYAADELEGVPLLLSGTWSDALGERLLTLWPTLAKREQALHLAAFHLSAHKQGLRASDCSLVVLDPDWLVNVTALSNVHACERIRLVKRYQPSEPSMYLTIGRVVNDLFPRIWNSHEADAARQDQELRRHTLSLAQSPLEEVDTVRDLVGRHVQTLETWARPKPRGSTLNTETYVISPGMGLKGRIDALWFRDGEPVVLAELKTGKFVDTDALQVTSYGLMLVSRGEARREISTLLLHSKAAPDRVQTRLQLDQEAFRKAVIMRNKVLLVDAATEAPFNEAHCTRCFANDRTTCTLLAHLGAHRDPRAEGLRKRYFDNDPRLATLGPTERAFFQRHEAELLDELRAVKAEHARLWSRTSEERERDGLAMRFAARHARPNPGGRHRYELIAGNDGNHSLFRPDDRVIVSGPAGPTRGRLLSASVVQTSPDGVEIDCDEPLGIDAGWINADTDEKLVEREFAALLSWIARATPLRDAVVHLRPPTLGPLPADYTPPTGIDLNPQQQRAVADAVRTRDYLLVLGPPGAGKTTLLRAMIEAHIARGQRVLVSAQTHRAVDQVVRKLIAAGLGQKVLRLGRYNAIADDVRPCTIEAIVDRTPAVEVQIDAIRRLCATRPVVAATATALAKGEFDRLLDTFDLVIIDEATQLSLPMSLAPLRYAKRFVLVGDPKQLAPIRLTRGNGVERDPTRGASLFETLEPNVRDHGGEGLVELADQYRMNDAICKIPSAMWYDGALRPGTVTVGEARQDIAHEHLDATLRQVLDPKRPVVFLDVPSDFSHGLRMNLNEAQWAARIVRAIHESDEKRNLHGDTRLGVLAPFRSQVACIRRELTQQLPAVQNSRRWVDTVDRFQGDERDVMIISLVGGRDGRIPDLLRDERRLNVALSRARHKLVLIGDHASLSGDAAFQRLFSVMADAVPNYLVSISP